MGAFIAFIAFMAFIPVAFIAFFMAKWFATFITLACTLAIWCFDGMLSEQFAAEG